MNERDAGLADSSEPRAPADLYQPPNPEPEENIQHSLFGEILDWMLAPLLLLWPMSIAITYLVAKSIANQPFDHALEDSVTVLAQQVREVDGRAVSRLPGTARDILRADDVDNVYFQVTGPDGEHVDGDRDLPLPAPSAEPLPHRHRPLPQRRACTAPRCASPIRYVNLRRGRARRRAARRRWCRWPRRSTSAPSWPTKSSRA